MKIKPYLVINSRGTVKVTKTPPALGYDEVCLQLNLELPDALFSKPRLEAKIVVPESAAVPAVVDSKTIDNLTEAIQKHTGIEVRLWVEEEKKDEE